jgi:DNA-directed RNA polymerase subunit omega
MIMAKQAQSEAKANSVAAEAGDVAPQMDSKYRLIIVAAQRSKQLQRGARPRVDMDIQRHKATRVALEEVQQGMISFNFTEIAA